MKIFVLNWVIVIVTLVGVMPLRPKFNSNHYANSFLKLRDSEVGSITVFNALLQDIAKRGDVAASDEVWKQIAEADISPNSFTYELLMETYINNGNFSDEPELCFYQLLRSGYKPSKRAIVRLLRYLGTANLPERAEKVFDRLSFFDIGLDVEMYNCLLFAWAYCRDSDSDAAGKAEELFQRLRFVGIQPDIASYELLALARCNSNRAGGAKRAYEVINKMKDVGLAPSLTLYERVLEALARDGRSAGASKLAIDVISSLRSDSAFNVSEKCYLYCMITFLKSGSSTRNIINAISEFINVMRSVPHSQGLFLGNILVLEATVLSQVSVRDGGGAARTARVIEEILRISSDDNRSSAAQPLSESLPPPWQILGLLAARYCREDLPDRAEPVLMQMAELSSRHEHFSLTISRNSGGHDHSTTTGFLGWDAITSLMEDSPWKCKFSYSFPWNCVLAAYGSHSADTSLKVLNNGPVKAEEFDTETMVSETIESFPPSVSFISGDASYRLYRIMLEKQVPVDHWTYTSLIGSWCSSAQPWKAQAFINELERQNEQMWDSGGEKEAPRAYPNLLRQRMYGTLIQGWLNVYKARTAVAARSKSARKISDTVQSDQSNIASLTFSLGEVEDIIRNQFDLLCNQYLSIHSVTTEPFCTVDNPDDGSDFGVSFSDVEDAFESILKVGSIRVTQSMCKNFLRVLGSVVGSDNLESNRRRSDITITIFNADDDDENFNADPKRDRTPTFRQSSVAEKALLVFRGMGLAGLEPDLESYELLLTVFEKSMEIDNKFGSLDYWAPQRALEIVQEKMIFRPDDTEGKMPPSAFIYEALIRIWTLSGDPGVPRKAEGILRTYIALSRFALFGVHHAPSEEAFFKVLKSWAQSPLPLSAERAEAVLETMIQASLRPRAEAYSWVAYAWAQVAKASVMESPGGPQGSAALPDFSETSSINSTTDTTTTHVNNFVTRIERVISMALEAAMAPDELMLRSLIIAWAKDGSVTSLKKVENLLILIAFGEISMSSLKLLSKDSSNRTDFERNLFSKESCRVLLSDARGRGETGVPLPALHFSVYAIVAQGWGSYSLQMSHNTDDDTSSVADAQFTIADELQPIVKAKLFVRRVQARGLRGRQLLLPFNLVLAAYSRWASASGFARAETLFNSMLKESRRGGGEDEEENDDTNEDAMMVPKADVNTVNIFFGVVIRSLSGLHLESSVDVKETIRRCEDILKYLPRTISPNHLTFQLMVKIWRAYDDLLDSDKRFRRSSRSISASVPKTALAAARLQTTEKAQKLFDVIARGNTTTKAAKSTRRLTEMYSTLLELWSLVDASRAENILQYMTQAGLFPESGSFASILRAWGAEGELGKCDAWFDKLISTGRKPDLTCSLAYVTAMAMNPANLSIALNSTVVAAAASFTTAKTAADDITGSGDRAAKAFDKLIRNNIRVDSYIVMSVLQALSMSRSSRAAGRAEEILQRALSVGVKPVCVLFNKLLDIVGKSGLRDSAEKTEDVLKRMKGHGIRPDIVTFNSVIAAWGRSRDALAEVKAYAIFDAIIDAGLQPDIVTYTSLLSAVGSKERSLLKSERGNGGSFISTETESQDRHARQGEQQHDCNDEVDMNDEKRRSVSAAGFGSIFDGKTMTERAEQIFAHMLRSGVRPDTRVWTILLSVWAKSDVPTPQKEDKVQSLFERMVMSGASVNIVTYTTLLGMYGSSRHPKAGVRVFEIFRRMRQSKMKLDIVGYSSLLSAIGRSDDPAAPLRAEEVFEQMIENGIKPDSVAWTIIITIFSRSSIIGKEAKVQRLYERMLEAGARPSGITYTSLLNMWASQKGRHPTARQHINEIYDRICSEYVRLDAKGFDALLKALKRAAPSPPNTPPPTSSVIASSAITAPSPPPVRAWRKEGLSPSPQSVPANPNPVDKAEFVLMRMVDHRITPSAQCWAFLISADNTRQAYSRSIRLYRSMIQAGVTPTRDVYAAMMEVMALSSSHEPGAFELAQELLQRAERSIPDVDVHIYNLYMQTVLLSCVESRIKKADRIRETFRRIRNRSPPVLPNVMTLDLVNRAHINVLRPHESGYAAFQQIVSEIAHLTSNNAMQG